MTKLTLKQEEDICQEYLNTNITQQELANKYYCSRSWIIILLKKKNIKRKYIHSNTKLNNLIFCNENYFEVIDTSAKSYYLGFIAGDGSLSVKENALRLKLAIKDKKFLEDFSIALESKYPIRIKHEFLKKTGKVYEECEIKIIRSKLITDLTKHGVGPNKSKELFISKTIPDELIKDFVRGIIDSDGCWSINSKNNISFSFLSSVYSFAEEIRTFLMKQCSLEEVKIIQRNGCWETTWGGNLQCNRIFKYLYSNGPWLDRKYKVASEHFANLHNLIKRDSYKNKYNQEEIKENPKTLSRILGFEN